MNEILRDRLWRKLEALPEEKYKTWLAEQQNLQRVDHHQCSRT